MHATKFTDKLLQPNCQAIHKKRLAVLSALVQACLQGQKLSVAGLGRAIDSQSYDKHNIKLAGRLVGNAHLHQERLMIYQAVAKSVIGSQTRPVIIVDWFDLSLDRKHHLLRTSIPVGGRALTLYEEVHPESKLCNRQVHKHFLNKLKYILHDECYPIVVTDAGFQTPWFRAVQKLGWDYLGRLTGRIMLTPHGQGIGYSPNIYIIQPYPVRAMWGMLI